jgi:hypothetical protein
MRFLRWSHISDLGEKSDFTYYENSRLVADELWQQPMVQGLPYGFEEDALHRGGGLGISSDTDMNADQTAPVDCAYWTWSKGVTLQKPSVTDLNP